MAVPGCDADIAEAVKYAAKNKIPLAPRAGHHCVTSTMRHLQDGMLIDLRSLNQMSFDEEARTVTAAGGVLTDDFVKFLHKHQMEVSKYRFESKPIYLPHFPQRETTD